VEVRDLHSWNLAPREAARLQRELRSQVSLRDEITLSDVRIVAGADNGYARRAAATIAFSAVVVLSFPDLELLETQTAICPVQFPYVPGLLSFREAPAILAAFRQVQTRPDVGLFDAHGYAHPRRFGAASHLGLLLDLPSIGCAKSRLIGSYEEPEPTFGARRPLIDHGEVVGAVVRSRAGRAPLFVSPGHKMSVDNAVAIALACCRGASIMPEPTRQADKLVRSLTRSARS
jgi:deoxyribonuclease V